MRSFRSIALFVCFAGVGCDSSHEAANAGAPSAQIPAPAVESVTKATIANVKLSLENGAAGCALIAGEAKALPIKLPAGCAFHTDANGAVRSMAKDGGIVVLIETSAAAGPGSKDCDTRVEAVLIRDGGAKPSGAISRVAACTPMQWDDAMFLGRPFPK